MAPKTPLTAITDEDFATAHVWTLYAHRWTAPVLTALAAAGGGAKFVTLERGLAVNKDSLSRTLDAAIAAGLVERNAGHGHPLRPEYVLTAVGRLAAHTIAPLQQEQARIGLAPGDVGRWGLPILCRLHLGAARFNAVARALIPITPRALNAALTTLSDHALINRSVTTQAPIAAIYALTSRGEPLARAAFAAAANHQ